MSLPVVNSVGYVLRFSRSCAEACCVRTSSVTSPSPLHRSLLLFFIPRWKALSRTAQVKCVLIKLYVTSVLLLFHTLLLPFNRAVFTSVPIQSTQHNLGLYIRLFFVFCFWMFCNLAIWLHLHSFLLLSIALLKMQRRPLVQAELFKWQWKVWVPLWVACGLSCLNSVGSLSLSPLSLSLLSLSLSPLSLSLSLSLIPAWMWFWSSRD